MMRLKTAILLLALLVLSFVFYIERNDEEPSATPFTAETPVPADSVETPPGIPIEQTFASGGLYLARNPCEYFSDLKGQPVRLEVVTLTSFPTETAGQSSVYTVAETNDPDGTTTLLALRGGRINEHRERSAAVSVEVGERLYVFLDSARWDERLSAYWITEEKVLYEDPSDGRHSIFGALHEDDRMVPPEELALHLPSLRAERSEDCYYDWGRPSTGEEFPSEVEGEQTIVLSPGAVLSDDDGGVHFPESPVSSDRPNE